MLKTRQLLSEQQIAERILALAKDLNLDYAGRTVDIVCVLKGSIMFASDLIRRLTFPVRVHFMQVQSYFEGTETSGTVHLHFSSDFKLAERDVLLVEDIVDTAITLRFVLDHLKENNPKELKTCVLLDKPSRRKLDLHPDYTGFVIEDEFVVGYGLDYKEFGRNMPYLAVLDEKE